MTEVPEGEREKAVSGLSAENCWGLGRFKDPEYLPRRFRTENKMREEFLKLGGKPELKNPIYFFLGEHPEFKKVEANLAYQIPLASIARETVSFTCGDSMFVFNEDYRSKIGGLYNSALCTRLYRLDDLVELLTHTDFPKENPLHIEAQLWVRPKL